MKRHIPNFFTSLHLFSGCIASVLAFNGEYLWAIIWVVIAAIFDFFDGFMARLLNAPSAIGKELDSLADMVSFGFAPSLLIFRFLSDYATNLTPFSTVNLYLPFFAFVLTIFSALRLAKFNIDERQTTSFIGLPTPANALFWISFIYGIHQSKAMEISETFSTVILCSILILIVVFSLLLTSEIPMFSLKTKDFKLKGNELRYSLIVFIIAAVSILEITGVAVGILFYIALSIISASKGPR